MKNTIFAALAALTLTNCKTDDPGPPPVAGMEETGEMSTGQCVGEHCMPMTTETGGVADTSTGDPGPDDCGQYARYTCRGWHAGIYKNGANLRFDFSTLPGGENWSKCRKFDICIPAIGEPDSEALFDACAAEDALNPPNYPAHPFTGGTSSAWTFDHVAYVFAEDGPSGIPGVVGAVDCTWNGEDPQVLYRECLPENECPAEAGQSCAGWSPSSKITSSYNSSTKTYTVTINRAWLDALVADMMDSYFVCDAGGWYWSTAVSPNKWRMQNLGTGELVTAMGFRNGDEQLKVKKTGTATWYNLYGSTEADGYNAALAAYAAVWGATGYTFEFKRSGVTYTMIVSLV